MWDEDFKQKKFELGRIIERDMPQMQRDLERMRLEGGADFEEMTEERRQKEKNRKDNQDRGRVIKTTNIDFFLNCDTMDLTELDEKIDTLPVAAALHHDDEEDEDDPEWNDIDVEEIKGATTTLGGGSAGIIKPIPQ